MDEDTLVAPVSVEHAQRVLHERLPHLHIATIAYVGGGSFSTFVINDALVFRFPKGGGAHLGLERRIAMEAALCNVLRSQVYPHEVPLLTHTLHGPSASFAGPIFGYELFRGEQVAQWRGDRAHMSHVATLLGDFLTKLHAMDMNIVYPLGFKHVTAQDIQQSWFRTYERHEQHVFPLLPREEHHWLAKLHEAFLTHAATIYPRVVLTHGDFGWENVLIPSPHDHLQVIDFEDAGGGDAVSDFCLWLGYYGKAFVYDMLDTYALPVASYFIERAQFYYGRIPCMYVEWGVQQHNDEMVRFGRRLLQQTIEQSKTW